MFLKNQFPIKTFMVFLSFYIVGCETQSVQFKSDSNLNDSSQYKVEVFPEHKKQKVLGLGVEIQSDSIGSGNNGLPEKPIAIPHDLVNSERVRLADEMLKGFRYVRLAGGLYWRGLDEEQKQLRPRWPEQLIEMKQLLDRAEVEGLSFEYWSPAPYWKANQSYIGKGKDDKLNTLRPFSKHFKSDSVYKGDRTLFFNDFAKAITNDIKTLENAGLKVSMFGLQNEPWVSNNSYSSNRYFSPQDYHAAFKPVASAVREFDKNIMIFADTGHAYPKFIAPFMNEPETAKLVDAYAVHTIGWDAGRVIEVDKNINQTLPKRPWFQNEYEYLTGGATPARTLNTVQHIMNSFQLAGNPTWFWLHMLKPISNAEASGYSLGFWNSKISPQEISHDNAKPRWYGGPKLSQLSSKYQAMEWVYARAGKRNKPGRGYTFISNQAVNVYLVAEIGTRNTIEGWDYTGEIILVDGIENKVFKRKFNKGKIIIPENNVKFNEQFGIPHAAFIEPVSKTELALQVGVNQPMYIHSQKLELLTLTKDLQPGHWTFNPYNWNAVGSFSKRMPWDSVILDVEVPNTNNNQAVLVYEKPNGKRTIVVANRDTQIANIKIDSNIKNAKWKGYRFTPFESGENTQGIEVGQKSGEELNIALPTLAWEFWEEQ